MSFIILQITFGLGGSFYLSVKSAGLFMSPPGEILEARVSTMAADDQSLLIVRLWTTKQTLIEMLQ